MFALKLYQLLPSQLGVRLTMFVEFVMIHLLLVQEVMVLDLTFLLLQHGQFHIFFVFLRH